jgi:hypothetical protein
MKSSTLAIAIASVFLLTYIIAVLAALWLREFREPAQLAAKPPPVWARVAGVQISLWAYCRAGIPTGMPTLPRGARSPT